jgi:hypothetical protein
MPDFVIDALNDSIQLIPFLFIIFVIIELFENYYSKKIAQLLKYSEKIGPIVGAVFAILPQCGFSIVASLLYVKNFISVGTLISVYIATSDEAIPILLSKPQEFSTVIKIVIIKFLLAIIAGYLTDLFIKRKTTKIDVEDAENEMAHEHGCCNHNLNEKKWKSVILHPIKHTLIIFCFIFGVCLLLNWAFEIFTQEKIETIMLHKSILQPVFAALFGLIPNCAVSVLLTMMYLKNVLSFGSVIAGLSSGAGLGLLILIKKNPDTKDTIKIISLLVFISIFIGILIQFYE